MAEKFGEEMSMEELLNSIEDKEIHTGKITEADVVTKDSEYLILNVGTKADGRVRIAEFGNNVPKIGDKVEVMLLSKGLRDGCYEFSYLKALRAGQWNKFKDNNKEGACVKGKYLRHVAKGMIFLCDDYECFLPFTVSADIHIKKDAKDDSLYDFKIVKVDERKRNVIISRKEFIDEVRTVAWDKFLETYNAGDHINGTVSRFVDFGAFVDLGGFEALLYKDDITWKKVYKKKKILKIGDVKEFIILDIKPEEHKVSLGLKQLQNDPWNSVHERYSIGQQVSGAIVTITNFGAFIEIEDGVEGFINVKDLSWVKKGIKAKDFFHKNEQLDVLILDIDFENRKIILGVKQLTENPWDSIEARYPIGSIFKSSVKKKVSFGVFVSLEEGIDGLIHVSDLTWDDDQRESVFESLNEGDEIEYKILAINRADEKISCGIKQLTPSPWEEVKDKYPIRSAQDGTISNITNFGLFVKLDDKTEGLVHISEASRKRIDDLNEFYKVGDQVKVVVLDIDVDKKRLMLSIKRFEINEEKQELNKIMGSGVSNTMTIGDMLKMNGEEDE